MRFAELLGNATLKAQLCAALDSGRLSHSYLLAGPAGSGKHTLARLLAAAMECEGPQPPCGVCRACRKALSGNHPDILMVDDPERKQVPVDLVRQARTGLFVRPNEGRRKVLIFPRAQDLNASAQNALLKVLEEPPDYGAFLLLARSPEALLPTIRSRCVELRLSPLDRETLLDALRQRFPDRPEADWEAAAARSGGFLGQAEALLQGDALQLPQAAQFAEAYAGRDTLALVELFCSMEKWKRNQLAPVLEQLRPLLAQALQARQGCPVLSPGARTIAERRTAQELLSACETVRQALEDCWANVSVANICAWLLVQLR